MNLFKHTVNLIYMDVFIAEYKNSFYYVPKNVQQEVVEIKKVMILMIFFSNELLIECFLLTFLHWIRIRQKHRIVSDP